MCDMDLNAQIPGCKMKYAHCKRLGTRFGWRGMPIRLSGHTFCTRQKAEESFLFFLDMRPESDGGMPRLLWIRISPRGQRARGRRGRAAGFRRAQKRFGGCLGRRIKHRSLDAHVLGTAPAQRCRSRSPRQNPVKVKSLSTNCPRTRVLWGGDLMRDRSLLLLALISTLLPGGPHTHTHLGPYSDEVVVICLQSPLPPCESLAPLSPSGAYGIFLAMVLVPGMKTPFWGC